MLHNIQPLEDSRWSKFLERHPRASVFHSVPWLRALHRTYGYEPVAITQAVPGDDLQDGIVFCRVNSWLTGCRLVSLPFSDHCEPLLDANEDIAALFPAWEENSRRENFSYIELRPLSPIQPPSASFQPTQSFCFHKLDLSPNLEELFKNCHKDSIQRKIRRAEREGLIYSEGQSEELLDSFYRLLMLTRRRHQVPPQPKRWYRNLIDCFGESLKIRVAFKGDLAVAAILTLRFKDTLVYKYGCSDARFHNLGAMHLLFWKAIEEAKTEGLRAFDFGRSDSDNAGLITFKDRWGATRSTLTYLRLSTADPSAMDIGSERADWKLQIAKCVFSRLPDGILNSIGNLIYKHIG